MFSVSVFAQWRQSNRFSTTANSKSYATETPATIFGLDNVYIFKDLSSASITYNTSSSNTVDFYFYQNSMSDRGAPILSDTGKTSYTITNLQDKDNRGILVNDNGQWFAVWIINYAQHKPILKGISAVESEDRCEALKLVIEKDDHPLEFRGTGGQLGTIPRKYNISYQLKKWEEANHSFVEETNVLEDLNIGTEWILSGNKVPNMNTKFTISGDQFGLKFAMPEEKESAEYQAVRVEAYTQAIQVPKGAVNEGQGEDQLGGSAPVDIAFYGYANDPVAHYYTWYVYSTRDRENHIARYTDKNFDYTFEQFGDYEVVLEVANGESSCVTQKKIPLKISDSDLKIPNFFRPGSVGANSEFKVYYKSLIKYHCVIFNRWGNKVWESRDPAQAWDGRYKGSFVNTGVYYYSIEATGSDNTKYKEGGDINVLR